MDLTNLCENLGSEFGIDPFVIWSEWNLYRLFESNIRMLKRKESHYKMLVRANGGTFKEDEEEEKRREESEANRDPKTGRLLPDMVKLLPFMS